MSRYLQQGMQISLKTKNGMHTRNFMIKEVVGTGASCVVYRAECEVEPGVFTEHLLKEYNPKLLFLKRKADGQLLIETDRQKELFEAGLPRFGQSCRKQLWFREEIAELKNPTANIEGMYSGNGTEYIAMSYFNGCTYAEIENLTLYRLINHMRDLAGAIHYYHENGYYHLDIKPDNVYVCPFNMTEVIMLFDFDSVTEQSAVQTAVLSYTQGWAAPEQILPGCAHKICAATDIYAIGEMIFHKVMGRHSNEWDRLSFSEYEYDKTQPLFQNVNPKVFSALSALFRKTINVNVSMRYQSARELLECLEELAELANPKAQYLVSNCPAPKDFFVGRDKELEEIRMLLEKNQVVFLHGIGGIGKSELAKQYATRYKELYDTILFAPYISDAESLMVSDSIIPVYNFYRMEGEEDYFTRKLTKLKALISQNAERILLIVDNFDTENKTDINLFAELGCKILYTTRINVSSLGFSQINIEALGNPEDVKRIFERYYTGRLSGVDQRDVEEMIQIVANHTMTVELIAKQIAAEWTTPAEILKRLKAQGLGGIGSEEIDSSKDNEIITKSTYEHIRALFDLSIFEKKKDENAIYVLANLSLFPYTGVTFELFAEWCELGKHGGKSCINSLVQKGWINKTFTESGYTISLHPVVADIASGLVKEEPERVSVCLRNLSTKEFVVRDNMQELERLEYALYVADSVVAYNIDSEMAVLFLGCNHWNARNLLGTQHQVERIRQYYKRAIELLEENLPEKAEMLVQVYKRKAHAIEGFFPKESEQLIKKAIELMIQFQLKKDELLLFALNVRLGISYYFQGKYKMARKQLLYSLTVAKPNYKMGEYTSEAVTTYHGLGVVYEALNKYIMAEFFYRISLRILKKASPAEDIYAAGLYYGLTEFYCSLAELYVRQSKYKSAVRLYKKGLEACESKEGEFGILIARVYRGMAICYKHIGKESEAEMLFLRAREIYGKIFGEQSEYVQLIDLLEDS